MKIPYFMFFQHFPDPSSSPCQLSPTSLFPSFLVLLSNSSNRHTMNISTFSPLFKSAVVTLGIFFSLTFFPRFQLQPTRRHRRHRHSTNFISSWWILIRFFMHNFPFQLKLWTSVISSLFTFFMLNFDFVAQLKKILTELENRKIIFPSSYFHIFSFSNERYIK